MLGQQNITHTYPLLYLREYKIRIALEEIKHFQDNCFSIECKGSAK